MKISLCINDASDLIPVKETLLDRFDSFIFKDPKKKMFRIYSHDAIFSQLKAAGLDGIEFLVPSHLTLQDTEKIKQILKKYKLQIFSVHQSRGTYLQIGLKEIERLCKIANDFSSGIIVIHINAIKRELNNPTFWGKLKDLQKEYNVNFGIENMTRTPFTLEPSMYSVHEFSQTVRQMGLNITLDTTHCGQVGEDICRLYEINKDRVVNIHLSDYKKNWLNTALYLTNDTHLPLGKGELPIAKFLKTLKEENYQGLITMEINGDLETLCQNARLINSLIR